MESRSWRQRAKVASPTRGIGFRLWGRGKSHNSMHISRPQLGEIKVEQLRGGSFRDLL